MKAKFYLKLIVIGALGVCAAYADKITFEELPKTVQEVVRGQLGNATAEDIEDIDRNVRDGQTFYEVAFKRGGKNVELLLGQDGTVLSGGSLVLTNPLSPPNEPLRGARKVTLVQVPQVVRKVIEAQAEGARIEDIDAGTLHGRTVYEAAFKRAGEHVELRVAEDGSILNQTDSTIAGEINRLPGAVREAIQAHVGGSKITDIDIERRSGATLYEIEFQRDGLDREIVFTQDGKVVIGRGAVGAAGVAPIVGRGALESARVRMDQVPLAVQETFRTQAGRASIDAIRRQVRDGQVIYEAGFLQGGERKEVEVAADGTLLKTKTVITPAIASRTPEATARLELRDLPEAVQKTARVHLGAGRITDIDQDSWNGRTVYEIEFTRDRRNYEVLVGEDGALLDDTRP